MVVVAGFGNALLDYIVHVDNVNILKKHNLKADDAKEISNQSLKALLDDISKKHTWICSSGGSVQNTLCFMKWLLPKHTIAMFGAIGNDEHGTLLKELLQTTGVTVNYAVVEAETGLIVSLVHKDQRSLVGNIGASALYRKEHLNASVEFLKSADLVYIEGFFLNHGDDDRLSEHILQSLSKNLFAFNINAVYLCEQIPDKMVHFVKKCHILFGNKKEFSAIAKLLNYSNVTELVVTLANEQKDKIVVMTNGAEPVFCAYGNGLREEFSVPKVKKKDIVDTTGAGDSFVAGFLSAHLMKKSVVVSIKAGCWVASQVIKQNGTKIPDVSTDTFNELLDGEE